ncbi:MAG TPA: sigma-70 family RNA polymerase sigma factor [Gaiellaceae bacterium]|nr:sigma-70 family RNA polymerase sigma factor [Gaiellaceae bacterium]
MSPFLLRRLSDESLGRRLAAGEAAAFDELYRRYAHRLAAYGGYLLGDHAAGEDVAQVTLLKAYGALRDGRNAEHVRPWLYRIAHNAALDLVGRRRELPSPDVPELPAAAQGPSPGALVEAVAALPETQRNVYVLRELHGLRIDETARELALSPTQVEQALFAARNRMAEHLVFGDRLSCVAVRRLAAGPLDTQERRALRTHLRSCAGCRQALRAKGRVLGVLPAGALDWLRALPGLLAGGGAPAAVKVGAVVATATLAAGTPVGYEIARDQNPTRGAAPAAAPQRPQPARRPVAVSHRVSAAHVQPVRLAPASTERRSEPHHAATSHAGSATHERGRGGPGPSRARPAHELEATSQQHGGGGSRHGPETVSTTPASTPPPVTTVATVEPAPTAQPTSSSGPGDGGTTTVSGSGDGVPGGSGNGGPGSSDDGGSGHGGDSGSSGHGGGGDGALHE